MWFSVNTAQFFSEWRMADKSFISWCLEALFPFGLRLFRFFPSLYFFYRLSFHFSCSEEKPVGFRLKPPTLIHGQAPSSGQCRKVFVSEFNVFLCVF